MTHVLGEMFGWPSGNVLGNLIASALWAAPALAHLHWRSNRRHRALLDEIRALRGEPKTSATVRETPEPRPQPR